MKVFVKSNFIVSMIISLKTNFHVIISTVLIKSKLKKSNIHCNIKKHISVLSFLLTICYYKDLNFLAFLTYPSITSY